MLHVFGMHAAGSLLCSSEHVPRANQRHDSANCIEKGDCCRLLVMPHMAVVLNASTLEGGHNHHLVFPNRVNGLTGSF